MGYSELGEKVCPTWPHGQALSGLGSAGLDSCSEQLDKASGHTSLYLQLTPLNCPLLLNFLDTRHLFIKAQFIPEAPFYRE